MSLKLYIDNGSGEVDYTRYVTPSSLNIQDSINVPTLLNFTISNIDNIFVMPVRSAYVRLYSTMTGRNLATGFVTSSPDSAFLGLSSHTPATNFQLMNMEVQVTSDEWLLNTKAVPFTPVFINRTMGQILSQLADILAPGFFDTSAIQDGDTVPFYKYSPTQKWSDIAKIFGDSARYRYKVVGKAIVFAPFGDASLGISYDDTLREKTFDPKALVTNSLSVPPVNDAIVIGDSEPHVIHKDHWIGDGFTDKFQLKHSVNKGVSSELLREDWDGEEFSSQWEVGDPYGQFYFGGALNVLPPSGALGTSYVLARNGLELGGHLLLQHGEFVFTDSSLGLIGAVFSGAQMDQAHCLAGFAAFSDYDLATDNFNRSTIGANWTQNPSARFITVGSTAVQPVTGSSSFATMYYNPVVWPADQFSELKITDSTNIQRLGICVRLSAGGNGYMLGYNGVFFYLCTLVANVVDATLAFSVLSLSNGDTLRLSVVGTSLKCYQNGVEILSAVDSTYSTGSAGLYGERGAATQPRGDDWKGGIAGIGNGLLVPSPSGAQNVGLQPVFMGIRVGPIVSTRVNHRYVLFTQIDTKRSTRYTQVYRTLAGNTLGGDSFSANSSVSWYIFDIDQGNPSADPVVMRYSQSSSFLPAFGIYALVVPSLMSAAINSTVLSMPPQGRLTVAGLTGASGSQLPLLNPGSAVTYPIGFGMLGQTATLQKSSGDADQVSFYTDTIPAAGARINFDSWEAGRAIARVSDASLIATEAAIAGDDGVRTAIFTNLSPLPRTSEECEQAAMAQIEDRSGSQYEGSYTVHTYFFASGANCPISGRHLAVNSPQRGIIGEEFLVRGVTTQILEMWRELMVFSVQFGQDTYVDKLLARFRPNATDVLAPADAAVEPTDQDITQIGLTYTTDLEQADATVISGTAALIDVGVTPVSGIEVRRADYGWGTSDQNLIATKTTQTFSLARTAYEQTYYLRQVNGAAISRRTTAIRIVQPLVPSAPTGTVDASNPLGPVISLDFTGDIRNIAMAEVRSSDNSTVLFRRRVLSKADLVFQVQGVQSSLTFYCYFINMLWEYSPAVNPTVLVNRSAHTSYRPTSNPLTAADVGASATVSVASFVMRSGSQDITISGGSIASLAFDTLYYVYYDQSIFATGSPTFNTTIVRENAINGDARYFVGSIKTPRDGGPDTVGRNDGGVGAQTGAPPFSFQFDTAVTQSTTGNGSISDASNVFDGNINTYATLQVDGNSAVNTVDFIINSAIASGCYANASVLQFTTELPTCSLDGNTLGPLDRVTVKISFNNGVSYTQLWRGNPSLPPTAAIAPSSNHNATYSKTTFRVVIPDGVDLGKVYFRVQLATITGLFPDTTGSLIFLVYDAQLLMNAGYTDDSPVYAYFR